MCVYTGYISVYVYEYIHWTTTVVFQDHRNKLVSCGSLALGLGQYVSYFHTEGPLIQEPVPDGY